MRNGGVCPARVARVKHIRHGQVFEGNKDATGQYQHCGKQCQVLFHDALRSTAGQSPAVGGL